MIRKYATPFFPLLLLWLSCTVSVAAREVPLPEEEAPTALFSAELYDAEVDFFIEGSWTASLQSGAGITWGDGITGVQPAVISDFTDGFKFEQVPQLTLSLWYMDRYFFETTITKEQQLETFLFGYFGEEGDFLQEARFGNTDIGYGDYGIFSIPEASRHSLGAYGRFEGGSSEHHLAVRYDPAQLEELHYRGSRLIDELRISPDNIIKGKFFILPDKGIENLKVYIQDDTEGTLTGGDGRRYRRVSDDEMVYSTAEGVIYLLETCRSDLVMYYEKNGMPVGSASLGTDALCGTKNGHLSLEAAPVDFAWSSSNSDYFSFAGIDDFSSWQRDIPGNNGQPSLLLYSPGRWNPFELLSVYAADSPVEAESGNTEMYLSEKNAPGGTRLSIEQFQKEEYARITSLSGIRSHSARYPLLHITEHSSWAEQIYGPENADTTVSIDKELRIEQLSPPGAYNLGTNVLKGSITVLRNGVPEQRFSYNTETGELNFLIPPGQNERIDIQFRTTDAQAIGGDIFAVAVNRFLLGEYWSADLNMGVRWNADPNAYIEDPGESQGSMRGAGRLSYQNDNFRFSIESGVNLRSPNTTGRLRLFGMDNSAFLVQINSELMYPGAPFTSLGSGSGGYETIPTSISSGTGSGLPHLQRGKLFFRDFYSYSFAGGYELQHYSWDPPGDQEYTYAQAGNENRTGPYIAATGSETEGNAMVLEYALENGEWAAGSIPVADQSGAIDLSHARAITLLVKHIGRGTSLPSGTINVHILFGRLNEDLDADGKLDEEDSALDEGFDFNITYDSEEFVLPVAPQLKWSPGDSRINTEDLDGNNVLDGSGAVLPLPVVKSTAAGDFTIPSAAENSSDSNAAWRRITIPLSEEDRKLLRSTTGIEFMLEENGEGPAEGRLLIADIDVQGSPFTGSTANATEFSVFARALDPGGSSYESLMEQSEAELLNGDSVFNTKVTRIEWAGPGPSTDEWTITGYHTPINLNEYEALSFFLKTSSGSLPETLTLTLQNPMQEGMAVTFSPPENHSDWRRYTWDLHTSDPETRLTVNGNPVPGGAELVSASRGITHNSSASGVNRLGLSGSISTAGSCEIDEIYLHEPRLDIGAGGRTSVEYQHLEPILSIGEVPLLHKVHFRQTVYGRQEGYQGGLSPAPAARLAFTNSLDFHLLQSSIGLTYDGQWDEEEYLPAGSYTLGIPLVGDILTIDDSYREQHTAEAIDIARQFGLSTRTPTQSSLDFETTLLWENEVLDRSWDFSAGFMEIEDFQLSLISKYQSRNSEIKPEQGNLGTRYARFNELLLPRHTSGSRYRKTEHSLQVNTHSSSISSALSHSLSSVTSPLSSPFSLTAGGGWNAKLSILLATFHGRSITLSHEYRRDSDFEAAYGEQNDFGDDLWALPNRLAESPLIWTEAPYYELWDGSFDTRFRETTAGQLSSFYTTGSNLQVERTPGSRLYDLCAPTRLTAGVERNLQRELDSISDTHILEGLYRATALNLFGRLGRYSLFTWYRTEEISHSVQYSSSLGKEESLHQLTFNQFVELNLTQQNILGTDNSWKEQLGEEQRTITSRLYWQRSHSYDARIPFEEKLQIQGDKMLQHTEEIEYSYSVDEGQTFTHGITAGHTSLLTLGKRGTLTGFSRIGYLCTENLNGDESIFRHNLAFEIGMELTLSF